MSQPGWFASSVQHLSFKEPGVPGFPLLLSSLAGADWGLTTFFSHISTFAIPFPTDQEGELRVREWSRYQIIQTDGWVHLDQQSSEVRKS